MPAPNDERQSLEQERTELRAQIAADERELAATTGQDRTRGEFLVWRIKRGTEPNRPGRDAAGSH